MRSVYNVKRRWLPYWRILAFVFAALAAALSPAITRSANQQLAFAVNPLKISGIPCPQAPVLNTACQSPQGGIPATDIGHDHHVGEAIEDPVWKPGGLTQPLNFRSANPAVAMAGSQDLLNRGLAEVVPVSVGFANFTVADASGGSAMLHVSVTALNVIVNFSHFSTAVSATLRLEFALQGRRIPYYHTISITAPLPANFTYELLNVPAYITYGPYAKSAARQVAPAASVDVYFSDGRTTLARQRKKIFVVEGSTNTITLEPS